MENTEGGAGTSKQVNALDEMIAKLAEINSNSADSSGMQNLRHFGKIIQVAVKFLFFICKYGHLYGFTVTKIDLTK